jgi:hypothetical protein
MSHHKFISTGGLGDAWIVLLKINQTVAKDADFFVDWVHVESNDNIAKACNDLFKSRDESKFKFTFECDPNYIENYKRGKWNGRIPVGSGVDNWCPLKGDNCISLEDPFAQSATDRLYHMIQSPGTSSEDIPWRYHVVIQVSAGAKNNRMWKFDPRSLAAILRNKGYHVALVGNDPKYKDESDDDNFVGKLSILDTTDVVRRSNLFIGLSGFLNYYASSMRVPNVHLIESDDHDKRYYHPEWRKISIGIRYPSLMEVNSAIKTMENFKVLK